MHAALRRALIVSAALVTTFVAASGAAAQQVPEKNKALVAMIDEFLKNPFNEDRRVGILDSATARPDVTITISTAVMPSACYKDQSKSVQALDALLLSAYVGGNMRAQLVAGRDREDVAAGLLAAIEMYKLIKGRVPNYTLPEVAAWQTAAEEGRLAAVVTEIQEEKKECKKKAARFPRDAQLAPSRPQRRRCDRLRHHVLVW